MGWPAPTDTKSTVKKAGDRIRKGGFEAEDVAILNRWRAAHGYIINTFQASLRTRTRNGHIPVVQRLKRGATIVDKLRQGRARDLSTMQDIAGIRLVFPDVTTMRDFRRSFHQTKAKHELVNENDRYDYMINPKISGYRGIHDIYKYRAGTESGAKWNGLQIEIQYRTLVQHAWATAVELSDIITENRTKFGQGTHSNTRFFQICSELLARCHEGSHSCIPSASQKELVDEWQDIEAKTHIFQQLKGVGVQEGIGDLEGFVLLILKPGDDLDVVLQPSYKQAVLRLINLEKDHPEWDIVLVRGDKGESLRNVFRNYFKNASEFIRMIEEATA